MMKKTIATMLLAVMQSAFAVSLMDGKYVNFEEYVMEKRIKPIRAHLPLGPNEGTEYIFESNPNFEDHKCGNGTLADYKAMCVNAVAGDAWALRYFTNSHLKGAFDEARELNGKGVYLPPGVWNFADQIVVPHGMTLKGSYDRPHNVTSADLHVTHVPNGSSSYVQVDWDKTHGTNIACYYGFNRLPVDYDEPVKRVVDYDACIALRGTATLDGVNVFYPIQVAPKLGVNFSPVFYPWTISCKSAESYKLDGSIFETDGNGEYVDPEEVRAESRDYLSRCSVMNTTLVNSYAGIDLSGSNDHYIKGVNMTAFRRGIRLDAITSQGAIEDVNIHTQFSWSYYDITNLAQGSDDGERANLMQSYTLNSLIGIDFRRVDWGWLNNVFIHKANRGFYFRRSYNGDSYNNLRAAASVNIQNSGCDLCRDAVYVYELNPGIGVNFSNCNLMGRIQSRSDNYGQIRITNSVLEFNAGDYGGEDLEGKHVYSRNHIEVAKNTTLQITNSEMTDFIEVGPGLWSGSTFNVRGKLLMDNNVLTWLNVDKYNLSKQKLKGKTVNKVLHFRQHKDAIIITDNLLLRAGSKDPKDTDLRSGRIGNDGEAEYVRQTNTYHEHLPLDAKDYYPPEKTAEEWRDYLIYVDAQEQGEVEEPAND